MTPQEFELRYLEDGPKLKGEFLAGESGREELLNRCEKYAGWTIPSVFPDDPLHEFEEMQNDYQSVGAQAATNLANKIMMALFQPAKPFFKMELSDEQMEELVADTGMKEAEVEAGLGAVERASMIKLAKAGARPVLTESALLLIITGNALLYWPEEEGKQPSKMSAYSLRDYIVNRDLRGNVIKMIIREKKCVASLGDELARMCRDNGYSEKDEISLYIGIKLLSDGKYYVWQEMEDLCHCHKRIGIYTEDTLPWIPLVWRLPRGRDYGTGLVEDYAGDFHTLSTIAEARLDYMTVATDVKFLVNPAGMTDVKELNESPSGSYVQGREGDIYTHLAQGVANVSEYLAGEFETVSRRIGAAFLLNTAVTRSAERVTAEEIRMQANELERSLGGVYSRLANELQLPLAKRLLTRMDEMFKDVEPTIVTGLESLSRNSEIDNWKMFFGDLVALADVPEQVAERIDYAQLIAVLGAGHGVDYGKVLLDEKIVQRNREQRSANVAQEEGMIAQAQAAAQPPQ